MGAHGSVSREAQTCQLKAMGTKKRKLYGNRIAFGIGRSDARRAFAPRFGHETFARPELSGERCRYREHLQAFRGV